MNNFGHASREYGRGSARFLPAYTCAFILLSSVAVESLFSGVVSFRRAWINMSAFICAREFWAPFCTSSCGAAPSHIP